MSFFENWLFGSILIFILLAISAATFSFLSWNGTCINYFISNWLFFVRGSLSLALFISIWDELYV